MARAGLTDLTRLPAELDRRARTCRAVIETPRGSRSKFDFDPRTRLFELAGLLPDGMSFPTDFGFCPSTKAEDGDPMDLMVLHDEPLPTGVLAMVRLIGVIEGEQTEEGRTFRNDRILAVTACSHLHENVADISELGSTFIDNLSGFWVNDNALKQKVFTVKAVSGPKQAVEILERSMTAPGRKRR